MRNLFKLTYLNMYIYVSSKNMNMICCIIILLFRLIRKYSPREMLACDNLAKYKDAIFLDVLLSIRSAILYLLLGILISYKPVYVCVPIHCHIHHVCVCMCMCVYKWLYTYLCVCMILCMY